MTTKIQNNKKLAKVYINLDNFDDEWLSATSELAVIAPFLSKGRRDKFLGHCDRLDARTTLLQDVMNEACEYFESTTIGEADIVFLPFKYGCSDAKPYLEEARRYGKRMVVFFNDDYAQQLPLPDDCVIFRTSFYRSKSKNNEYAVPTFSGDFYEADNLLTKTDKPTIGFCGGITHSIRTKCLRKLQESRSIDSDFIIRDGFWAPGVLKEKAIEEFNNNIRRSLYGFCCRGAGNFSFRFGEILSHGRIPILIDTDCSIPYENSIDWKEHAVIIPERDIENIVEIIVEHYEGLTDDDLMDVQINNRNIWKSHFTPLGFCKNLSKLIVEGTL